MTSSPKKASSTSRTTVTTAPTPAVSGVPTAQPTSPPEPGSPCFGPCSAPPPATEAMPSTAAVMQSQPISRRPRPSGSAGCRSSRREAKRKNTGRTTTIEPTIQREPVAIPSPTGPMPLVHTAAPSTTASPRTARPTPSRRCSGASGSVSSGRATERATLPTPRASSVQPPPTRRGGPAVARGRPLGGRPLARRGRPGAAPGGRRRPSIRRGAGRHASDGNPENPLDRAGQPSCPPPNVTGVELPYGSWPTPITSELVVRAAARPAGVVVDGDGVWWGESRPGEAGRTAVVRDGADVLPPP